MRRIHARWPGLHAPRAARLAAATAALLVGAGCSGPAGPLAGGTAAPATSQATIPVLPEPLPALAQTELDYRLIDAAWDDDVARVRRLIRRGADVNAKDSTVQNAYLIATSEGYLDLLELTLRHGARVNAKDRFDGTGLTRAAERGHWRVAGRLVRAGISVNHVNNLGWTALHEAIILGDGSRRYLDTVRVLVAAGADVERRSRRDGVSPVEHADSLGYAAIAHLLRATSAAEARGRPDRQTANRRLLRAAATGDADAAALALRADARVESRDAARRTPLLLAVSHDNPAVARVLVALGAGP